MSASPFDTLIIGCGPGGSTAATFLARAGRSVLVLEKETFPRFHIGESLLPYNRALFEEMGVWPALEAAAFPRKLGAQFHVANGSKRRRFDFREARFARQTEAIQVERARFDHILMQHARSSGAEIREGWAVRRFLQDDQGVAVEATAPDGASHTFRGKFLLDASGRGNVTGNQEGLREIHPRHRKYAVFGHFTGVKLDDGEAGGDIVIVRSEDRWFWLIPVSSEKTSVGLVLDKTDLQRAGGNPEAAFQETIRISPVMRERMARASPVSPLQTTADFSYFNRRLVGPRLLRIGDAAGFMDPIFSAGVYLAMWSGRLAARSVCETLATGGDGGRRFTAYEKRVRSALRVYWRLVEHYYTRPFIELFFEPRSRLDLPAAVITVLAGDFEPRWPVRWRLELFYLFVRLHKRWPIVPGINFSPAEPKPMS